MSLWRAATDSYGGPGACYASWRADAEAYQDNPGFGGPVLYEVELAADARVLDLVIDEHTEDWDLLAAETGSEDIREDMGWAGYTVIGIYLDDRPALVEELIERGWTHVRYLDDYPDGCETTMRIAPGVDTLREAR